MYIRWARHRDIVHELRKKWCRHSVNFTREYLYLASSLYHWASLEQWLSNILSNSSAIFATISAGDCALYLPSLTIAPLGGQHFVSCVAGLWYKSFEIWRPFAICCFAATWSALFARPLAIKSVKSLSSVSSSSQYVQYRNHTSFCFAAPASPAYYSLASWCCYLK